MVGLAVGLTVGLTLDAGALIGVERRSARMATLLVEARRSGVRVRIPAPVLAQVLRGRDEQVLLARLLKRPETAVIPFDESAARASGALLAASGARDVVGAAVVVCAWKHRDRVVTSDPGDLRQLDPGLELVEL